VLSPGLLDISSKAFRTTVDEIEAGLYLSHPKMALLNKIIEEEGDQNVRFYSYETIVSFQIFTVSQIVVVAEASEVAREISQNLKKIAKSFSLLTPTTEEEFALAKCDPFRNVSRLCVQ